MTSGPVIRNGADANWLYSGVKLTIHNIIIPEERLSPTPSQLDGMDSEMEVELRIIGCELIQDSGALLKLPQVAMATAQVLYQRFFHSKSFVRHFYEHYSMACVFLASKLEECPRRIRDVINVFHHIRQLREDKTPTPVMLDQSYTNMKNQVIKAERRVLKELGFCVHAKHPHKLIICYLQALSQETNQSLVQTSWNYMNDSLRTDLFVRYLPEAIACACIYLASCKLGVPLPRHPAWWEMFTVDDESVHEIALCLMRLYARPRSNVATLESRLGKLRKSLVETKEREFAMRKQAQSSTPGAASEHSSNSTSPPQNDDAKLNNDQQRVPVVATDVRDDNYDRVFNCQSLLASALATAKAVAATITATKASQLDSDVDMKSQITSGAVNETKAVQLRNGRRGAADTSPDFNPKRNEEQASSRRPMAYPSVPAVVEDQLDANLSRKRKQNPSNHQLTSSRTARSSHPGDSDSPPASDPAVNVGPPMAYSLVNNSRHYRRQQTNDASSNSSPSSVSPSPTKKKYNGVIYGSSSSTKPTRDQSSSSNTSSSHSDNHGSSRHRGSGNDSRKNKRSQGDEERNGPQPPKAYRTDNKSRDDQSSSSKHRSSGGGSGSKSKSSGKSHTRHRRHRHRDTDEKRSVNSHERRRR